MLLASSSSSASNQSTAATYSVVNRTTWNWTELKSYPKQILPQGLQVWSSILYNLFKNNFNFNSHQNIKTVCLKLEMEKNKVSRFTNSKQGYTSIIVFTVVECCILSFYVDGHINLTKELCSFSRLTAYVLPFFDFFACLV